MNVSIWPRVAAFLLIGPAGPFAAQGYRVGPVPPALGLDPFYTQMVDAHGVPVLGSARVTESALKEAAFLVDTMLSARPDVRAAMVKNHLRCVVMAASERTTDLPEQRDMKPKEFWDVRARGLGASKHTPVVSCGEENLLGSTGDPYKGENILIHEFAHAMHGLGLVDVDPTFDRRLRSAYDGAIGRGLWKGTYAASSPEEYWAEAVQSWFDCNLDPPDFQHNEVDTREDLRAYDPAVSALVEEVYGKSAWRYAPVARRGPNDPGHLAGHDPARAPVFSWGAARKKYDEVVAEKKRLRQREAERP